MTDHVEGADPQKDMKAEHAFSKLGRVLILSWFLEVDV